MREALVCFLLSRFCVSWVLNKFLTLLTSRNDAARRARKGLSFGESVSKRGSDIFGGYKRKYENFYICWVYFHREIDPTSILRRKMIFFVFECNYLLFWVNYLRKWCRKIGKFWYMLGLFPQGNRPNINFKSKMKFIVFECSYLLFWVNYCRKLWKN